MEVEDGRGVDRIREWVDLEGISIVTCRIVRNQSYQVRVG